MINMTEEEARAIMKIHRWSYKERKPRKKAKYVYAKRKKGGELLERYICPLSQLAELTEAELVAKLALTPEPTEKTSKAECEPEVSETPSPPTNTDES